MGPAFGRKKNKRKTQQRGYATDTKINTKERRRKHSDTIVEEQLTPKVRGTSHLQKKAFFSKVFTFIFTHNDTFLGWFSNKEHTKVAFKQNLHSTYYGNRNNSNNPMRERGFCVFFPSYFSSALSMWIYLVTRRKITEQVGILCAMTYKRFEKMVNVKTKYSQADASRGKKASKTRQYKKRKRSTMLRKGTSSANTNRVATVIAFGELKYFRSSSFFNVFSLGLAYFFLVVFCFSFHSFCHIKLSSWRNFFLWKTNEEEQNQWRK